MGFHKGYLLTHPFLKNINDLLSAPKMAQYEVETYVGDTHWQTLLVNNFVNLVKWFFLNMFPILWIV